MKDKALSVRIDEDIYIIFKKACEKDRRKIAEVIRENMLKYARERWFDLDQ